MLSIDKIEQYLKLFKGLSLTDLYQLFKLAKEVKIPAGTIYISKGVNFRKVAYIKKGLIRGYMKKPNGDEATIIIRHEDQFIASYDSIINNQPGRGTYLTVEDTTLLEVDFDELMSYIDKNPQYYEGRKFFLNAIAKDLFDRIESFILLSPEERYDEFISTNKNIEQRVPDKHIASFLGITPVSLSRIRKRRIERNRN